MGRNALPWHLFQQRDQQVQRDFENAVIQAIVD
jgi:hypothetical protein